MAIYQMFFILFFNIGENNAKDLELYQQSFY